MEKQKIKKTDNLQPALTLKDALQDIEISFRQLEFTIKLLSFCETGKINADDFDTDHIVKLPEGNLHFPSGYFKDVNNIIGAANVCFLTACAASALALDKGFEAKGLNLNPIATNNEDQLRLLIYLVRCAYAHGVSEPRWDVKKHNMRTLTINLNRVTISIDLQKLNGEVFTFEQLGGYINWYRIKDAAVHVLSQ